MRGWGRRNGEGGGGVLKGMGYMGGDRIFGSSKKRVVYIFQKRG